MKTLQRFLFLPLLLCGSAFAGAEVVHTEVAYAKPMRFDYDRDGTMNKIQMWATIVVTKEKTGYKGYLRRYMKDIGSDKPVLGYADINMLPNEPYGEKIPLENIAIKGKSALFKAAGKNYILIDGGEGYEKDTAIVNDGNRDYFVKLYDGDIRIEPEKESR